MFNTEPATTPSLGATDVGAPVGSVTAGVLSPSEPEQLAATVIVATTPRASQYFRLFILPPILLRDESAVAW